MRTNVKLHEIHRALALQKQTGRPSLLLSTRPVVQAAPTTSTQSFPGNRNLRAKKRPMEEAEKLEIFKRTGSMPYLEVVFK